MPVEAHDDPKIGTEELLIRRINPVEHVVKDENIGGYRLSTKAFSSSSEAPYGMSVDSLGLMVKAGINPKDFVTNPKYTASVQFTAGAARAANLWVGYDPLDEDGSNPANPYHAEVWSQPNPAQRFTKGQQRALMKACEWFVEIPEVKIVR